MKQILVKNGLNVTPEMRKPMRWMLIIVAVLFGLVFAWQLFKNVMMKKYMSAGMPPATVTALKATLKPWDPKIIASGSVKAVEGVMVTTQIDGMVSEILFEPGAQVQQDQPLIQMHDSTETAILRSLEANADLARITLTRDRAQFDIKAVSQATLDTDVANVKYTQAQVDQQQSTVNKKRIKAPFSGRLGVRLVNLGQFLKPGDNIVTLQRLDPIL